MRKIIAVVLFLAIATFNASTTSTLADGGQIIGNIDASMKAHLQAIMANGQSKGERINVFSKIGDSITESMAFLSDFGTPGYYTLGTDYNYLQNIIDYYSSVIVGAQGGTDKNSFNWQSMSANAGDTSESPFYENMLMHEINQVKPGIAIIMLGTNDIGYGYPTFEGFKSNMNAIVNTLEAEGVIPVLSTIPDRLDNASYGAHVPVFNAAIKELATNHQIPQIDYWLALQTLPNKGIDSDGIHPNVYKPGEFYRGCDMTNEGLQYGFNVRNKTFLDMLIKIKRIVIDNGAPDSPTGDDLSPTGTININNGATYTRTTGVTLSLSAQDNASGLAGMQFSNDGVNYTNWQSFATSKAWTLTTGDGVKTVYVKYKDGKGNTSSAYADAINLITQKTLKRLSGETRYETAVEISKEGWTTSDYVILARGDLFPDALAGAPLAAKYNAPILLTNPELLTQSTEEEIVRLKAEEVFILGSGDAISAQVVSDLEAKCSIENVKIHRYGGETRYDTAADIARQLSKPPHKTAIIATGENYPDALSAAPVAAYKGMPILLVKGGLSPVPEATSQALKDLGIESLFLMGGEDVIPAHNVEWLAEQNYKIARFAGETRYETCRAIADWALSQGGMSAENISVAVGENFPDALTVAPLAARNKGLIALVRGTFIPDSIKQFITNHKNLTYLVYLAGGSDVVSDGVKDEIRGIIGI